ncbi:efflux transporter outer membrane subunit [Hymenobacter sp. BT559]|uniref:efflux transporter outer membrane subunit n=1 Tax=Hymenobacter sp. BT559 TaxID=2795729 RepID=UPI0018EBD4F2|nr:efflux transporter outer membrane subunit [Hymenobacter sp. BT559]MBJ6144720.1 efflux transporter outer membrane subunit [Hymenobacter sp. BT559]
MTTAKLPRLLLPLLLLAGSGCDILRPYGRPDTATTGLYRDRTPTDTTSLAQRPWQQLFTDPNLQKLIAEGIENNRNLKVADARIAQAQALLAQSRAAFLPSLTGRATTTLSRAGGAFVSTGIGGGSTTVGGTTGTGVGGIGTGTGGTGTGTGTGGTGTGGTGTGTGGTGTGTGTGGTGTGVGGTGTSTTTDQSTVVTGGAAHQYLLGLSSSWEADVWGKLRSTRRAYAASVMQSEAYRRVVLTQLIADIADNYYSLLALDAQLEITRQTVKNRIQDVETMKLLLEGDVVTGAAVVQSEANRYAAEVTIPDLERNIREAENLLATLLGRTPGPIARGTLTGQDAPPELLTGVPGQLLRNRPDVQQAEYAFASNFEFTNAARTYFYPSFTITANGGLTTTTLTNLFSPNAIFASIVGGLAQPIFSQGLNRARLRRSEALQQEYLYTYQQTMFVAGQEVSNALFSYQSAADKKRIRAQQLAALNLSVDYTQELLRAGFANYTEVLQAQQSLLQAQLNSVNDELQQRQAVTDLYHALGGGWQ